MDTLKVVDFTEYPGLRHCKISDDSGEEFYHKYLNHAFKNAFEEGVVLQVDLDYTAGYAPSFLDEAFGNLVYDFGLEVVKKYLRIKSEQEPDLIEVLNSQTLPQWEVRRRKGDQPKITGKHEDWFYLQDGVVKQKMGNG